MKFYAVFKTTVEKHVELDAANWQEAAKLANDMERPIVKAEPSLEVVALCVCEEPEFCSNYDAAHEVCGPCNKCETQILERSCDDACEGLHTEDKGGWVSTEHGHVAWCSQACRDADKPNDPEVEVLDRMAGIE